MRGTNGTDNPMTFRGLHGQIVEKLGHAIGTREIVTGARIVPEEIAATWDVSRAVVREALKVLEAKGMLQAAPRTGTNVRDESEWNLLDSAVIRWRASGPAASSQFTHLLQFREGIEPLAARLASELAFSPELDQLREAVDSMAASVDKHDNEAFVEADVRFHLTLLAASHNPVIAQLGEPIEAALRVRHELNLTPETPSEETVRTHRMIVDAIASGEGGQAELASRRVVDIARAELIAPFLTADQG